MPTLTRLFVLKLKPRKSKATNIDLKNVEYHFWRTTSGNDEKALREKEKSFDANDVVDFMIEEVTMQAKVHGRGFANYLVEFFQQAAMAGQIKIEEFVKDGATATEMSTSRTKNRQDFMRLIDQLLVEYNSRPA